MLAITPRSLISLFIARDKILWFSSKCFINWVLVTNLVYKFIKSIKSIQFAAWIQSLKRLILNVGGYMYIGIIYRCFVQRVPIILNTIHVLHLQWYNIKLSTFSCWSILFLQQHFPSKAFLVGNQSASTLTFTGVRPYHLKDASQSWLF